jgi:hypothetical protein
MYSDSSLFISSIAAFKASPLKVASVSPVIISILLALSLKIEFAISSARFSTLFSTI